METPAGGSIMINRSIQDDNGNIIRDAAGQETGCNAFETFVNDIVPGTNEPILKRVIVIDDNIATDAITGEVMPGIKLYRYGRYTILSNEGIETNGKGRTIGALLGWTIKACGIFSTRFTCNDVGTIVAGLYTRALNSGTSKTYAAFFDGDVLTQGIAIAEGFALDPACQDNPGSAVTEYMRSGFNLFTNKNSIGSQTFYLPMVAGYEQLEEIEVSDCNNNEINIRPQTGNSINGYNNTQKRLRLYAPGHCCKLRADKINNTWIIVSMAGEFTAA